MDLHDARWRKSSRSSGGGNGDCVEVAFVAEAVAVRDSKDPAGPMLVFTGQAWQGFVRALMTGVLSE